MLLSKTSFIKIKSIAFKNIFPLLLILITTLLCALNYEAGTWLSGWDTLHPEFNFQLYFKRIFFGVWQEHQGLGATASQAHPAELIRMLFLYPLSFILPVSFLRYSYFFITLIVGPLGAYYFLNRVILKDSETIIKNQLSFLGSLFYLLNLSTIQHYYVPLEMFATHFATLPWIFLFTTKFIEKAEKKNLFYLSFACLAAAPMAHTATLFYTFFGLLIWYLAFLTRLNKKRIIRALIILSTILILNSFWLLPNIYFIINHSKLVTNSKIHSQFSDKAFLTSKKYGDIQNTALLKNFLFEWGEYDDTKNQFTGLLDEWLQHIKKPQVYIVGYAVFFLVITGIWFTFKSRNIYGISFLPIFAISMFFIANNNWLFNTLNTYLQTKTTIINEALRFPFTKFSIILSFTYVVYFTLSLKYLFTLLKRFSHFKLLTAIKTVAITLLLIWFALPAFQGNLISPSMKVKIPEEYFQAFKWFSEQEKDSRIAHLPIHTFWGWVYYKWQYEGAGFIWFGLEQPVLDREFDRWDPHNENFYWEASHAVYSKNLLLLESVLNKYDVRWLWVDGNIINPSSSKSIYLDEIQSLIKNSTKIKQAASFGNINIYSVNLEKPNNSFVYKLDSITNIGPSYKSTNKDIAFLENSNYVTTDDKADAYYPFRTLFTGRNIQELDFFIQEFDNFYLFKKEIPTVYSEYYLEIPGVTKDKLLKVDKKTLKYSPVSPEAYFRENSIEVIVPKVHGYLSDKFEVADSANFIDTNKPADNCNSTRNGWVKNEKITEKNKNYTRITAQDAYNCSAVFWLPNMNNDTSYLVSIESRNISGKPGMFWIENLNARRSDMETYLPKNKEITRNFFIQPPMENDGVGYNLHLDGISIGSETSINDYGSITVDPIPYGYLTGLALRKKQPTTSIVKSITSIKKNASLYQIKIEQPSTSILVLSQSFEKGWIALTIDEKKINFLKHLTVNGWSNGWSLENIKAGQTIYLLYWPEALQFIGLICCVLLFVTLFLRLRRKVKLLDYLKIKRLKKVKILTKTTR